MKHFDTGLLHLDLRLVTKLYNKLDILQLRSKILNILLKVKPMDFIQCSGTFLSVTTVNNSQL